MAQTSNKIFGSITRRTRGGPIGNSIVQKISLEKDGTYSAAYTSTREGTLFVCSTRQAEFKTGRRLHLDLQTISTRALHLDRLKCSRHGSNPRCIFCTEKPTFRRIGLPHRRSGSRFITTTACLRQQIDEFKIRPYDEIPARKSYLPALFGLIMSGGPGYLHEHCDARHKELGPIFREKLGSHELVFICNTKMIQTVVANEGQFPHHSIPEAWLLYNQVRQIDRGLFFQVGEPWLKLRRAMNKIMLADATKTRRFTDVIQVVNNDLLDSWCKGLRGGEHSGGGSFTVEDVKFELCKWSIEATGVMLFGQRMGCLTGSGSHCSGRAEELVTSVAAMFHQTSTFQIVPPKLAQKLNLRSWHRFMGASDKMIELASQFATEFIARAKLPGSSESFTKDLLDLKSLDEGEISRSMVDLVIAAADTTSNSLQWMLYMLARHQDVQSKILLELRDARESSQHDCDMNAPVSSTPYLSAFIKEVSRLYPTAPFLARTLDHEIELGGYTIPAGKPIVFSLYTTSRMNEYFVEANKFKPERWLRGQGPSKSINRDQEVAGTRQPPNHAYASLPFGIGARMCIGRRMADLEMHLLIASIVSRFEVSLANQNEEIEIKLKMILCPDKPISLIFKPRQ